MLSHSRSSSNIGGDDGERDWEDDDAMSASVTGLGMPLGGSQGSEEWDFTAGTGLNVPGFTSNAFPAAPGEEEWRRWAQSEIIKERRRVQRLVGVVKALADVSGKGGASLGQMMEREPDGCKF